MTTEHEHPRRYPGPLLLAEWLHASTTDLVEHHLLDVRRRWEELVRPYLADLSRREWEDFLNEVATPLTTEAWNLALAVGWDHIRPEHPGAYEPGA